MANESILSLSDSTKSDVRRYAMFCGFALISLWSLSMLLIASNEPVSLLEFTICASLVFLGVVLALLHKRDLVAMLFIMYGCLVGVYGITEHPHELPFVLTIILMGIMVLFTRNEQRVPVSVVMILSGVTLLFGGLPFMVLMSIQMVFCIYCTLCLGVDRFKLPFTDTLMADETVPENDGAPVHFKISGAAIGYMAFAAVCLQYALHYANLLPYDLTADPYHNIDAITGLIIILSGAIMLVAGRMRYTPFMFIIMGLLVFITPWVSSLYIVIGAGLIMLGIITLFRKDSRILAGIAIITYGLTAFCTDLLGPNVPEATLVLNIVPFLLCTYISFALCSDGRLKLV